MDAKLNQSDLIALLAKGSNISMATAELFTKNFFELIIEGLEQDGIVKINGLGTFKVTEVASRGSVNVNTGEKIEIKGHKKLVFIPADALKDSMNQPFAMFEPVEVDETYQPDATAADADNEETDEPAEVAAATQIAEEPVIEEQAVETPGVEEQPVEEPIEEPVAVCEPEAEMVAETVSEPEVSAENKEIVTEEQNGTSEAQQETVAVVETVEEPVGVQEKQAEPVMVRVAEKKQIPSDTPVTKKKKSVWLYTMIAAVVVTAAYFGYTAISESEVSKEENAAVESEKTIKVAQAGNNVTPVATIITGTGTTLYITESQINVERENSSDTNIPEIVDDEPIIVDDATVIEDVSDVNSPTGNEIDVVIEEPYELEQEIITESVIEEKVVDEEPYSFVMVEELASKRLKDITLADTTLYVAESEICMHKVAPDETLTKIARQYFGDKKLWPYIVKYNNMDKPDALRNGMEIHIPRLKPKK